MDTQTVSAKISQLFGPENQDLIRGFDNFLPAATTQVYLYIYINVRERASERERERESESERERDRESIHTYIHTYIHIYQGQRPRTPPHSSMSVWGGGVSDAYGGQSRGLTSPGLSGRPLTAAAAIASVPRSLQVCVCVCVCVCVVCVCVCVCCKWWCSYKVSKSGRPLTAAMYTHTHTLAGLGSS
jgi:hypothetical protein